MSCDRAVGVGPNTVPSAPDAIGQAIEQYLQQKDGVPEALPLVQPATVGQTQMQAAASGVRPVPLGTVGS